MSGRTSPTRFAAYFLASPDPRTRLVGEVLARRYRPESLFTREGPPAPKARVEARIARRNAARAARKIPDGMDLPKSGA